MENIPFHKSQQWTIRNEHHLDRKTASAVSVQVCGLVPKLLKSYFILQRITLVKTICYLCITTASSFYTYFSHLEPAQRHLFSPKPRSMAKRVHFRILDCEGASTCISVWKVDKHMCSAVACSVTFSHAKSMGILHLNIHWLSAST